MNNSQTQKPPNFAKALLGLIKDHVELATLECVYEKEAGQRRAVGLAAGVALLFFSFLFLQLCIVGLLHRMGLGFASIGLMGCLFYGGIAYYLLKRALARDPGVGKPFQSSIQQVKRSFEWIESRFS